MKTNFSYRHLFKGVFQINVKLTEKNEFAAHFVQKCLETRENEQNVVLNESSEALGNHSVIVRILVLAITTADDDASGSNFVSEVVVFRCFTDKIVLFGSLKAKQLILVSKIILTDPHVASRDLQGRRKPYKFGVQVSSSRLCSVQALGSIQRDRFMQTSLSEVSSMYCKK